MDYLINAGRMILHNIHSISPRFQCSRHANNPIAEAASTVGPANTRYESTTALGS